ncbi:hypothetical protein, partial [Pseudomonas sp. 2995-1]|uniref:hypothetical protein n=1 Tax=Pseudomonas sp. 2995-1 TaxID=1712679 RepID=UPI001C4430BB
MEDISYYQIGDIFNEELFHESNWNVQDELVTFRGHYNGEIFPGEPSHLTFTFHPDADGYYYSTNIRYNGSDVTDD